ncbi:uncharacterized protein LOC113493057 isoform X3 [Trichoplusia ni]|uniref:Uncharacterized protein LOC113493057 isoform X3 n=1 Tax=Trichoplusia ni TaxID=7111 RepID=A0A7E5VEC5_TRINI|nr:uncharacterized protein LOC113493057 isoform X3 [Trichoplusia ni]XP_026726643.1 uncharacterized protein LOC113493057 isoform X3 [Trichoplusia ni]
MFTNFKFPWILNPESRFGYAWHKIFYFTLCLVLYTYPINLIRPRIPEWFIFFSFWVDLAYAFDLGVSLCTAMKKRGNVTTTFYVLLFERFKSFTFILDLMSTIWIEDLAEIVGFSQYYFTLQFNRLIRIYRLFYGVYLKWEISKDPGLDIMRNLILTNIAVVVIMGHVVYELHSHLPSLSLHYFFGDQLCEKFPNVTCDEVSPFTGVTVLWYFEQIYNEYEPTNLTDVYAGTVVAYIGFCFATFLRCKYISYLFLRHKHITKYQQFVTAFVDFYKCYRINRDLLKRINRYLICHWKYHKGVEIIYQNSLRNEPIEVYYKAQVEVAQKIIGQCRSFQHANPLLIRELAYKAKFLILPRNAIIYSFGNQCKNVTWIVEGYVKVEQYNDNGELVPSYMTGGLMMSVCAVFFSKPSLQAYTAYTECEVLYIPVNDFIEVYKRFKFEYSFLITCKTEYGPEFDTMFRNNVLKHKDYQSAMRSRIQSTRMSMMTTSKVLVGFEENRSLPFEGIFWGEPETRFLRAWLVFRTVIVGLSIMSASCLGGIGAVFRWTFAKISAFCDCIAWIDIIIKLFLYYYDHRGILITSKRKCFFNYISKGFILDIIGVVPVYQIIQLFMTQTISIDNCLLMNTICRFAHIYILFACFEYVGDLPTVNIAYIMILKWQIVNILIVFGASHYLMVNCVNFVFDEDMELIDIQRRNDCWMPKYLHQPTKLNPSQLHLIFAESLSLAESGMMKMNFGRFIINRENLGVGMLLIGIGLIIWFISCFSVTLLVLSYQGDVAYRQDVYHLETFLTSERVEKKLIQRVIAHLRYYWLRTKGSNVQEMMTDRVGILFRQDINYSFYHKTFIILDTILGGGEMMQRNLAGAAIQGFFLPDYDIFREMDLVSNVCIVHRGRVHIWQQGKRLIVLSKGDIFGQLQGTKLRPIRVTATSAEMVDLLYIDVQMFQSIITDKIRETIAKNPQHKKDFLATAKLYIENPYDTVQYLIRGCKTIKLPWSKGPCENRNRTWYSRWLFLTWFIGPCASSIIVLNFTLLPEWSILWFRFYIVLYVLDIIHLAQMVSEFLTIGFTRLMGE